MEHFFFTTLFPKVRSRNMKLEKKNMAAISLMLFSLFFGAGNLIFPPFLGQNAGKATPVATIGFLITAVVLPVLGVIVVAKFDGLEKLGRKVSPKFAIIFTVLIYLSIGPGLGIPRAASVPYEMAVAPYLPEGANITLFRVIYSLVFFLIALWLCLNPGKLVNRVGKILTPMTLTGLLFLFITFLIKGQTSIAPPAEAYQNASFLQGFIDGYQTMDTIAALNFGLVIAVTLNSFGVNDKKDVIHHTVKAGIVAGSILAAVYCILTYMGMCSSNVYHGINNGAETLRNIVYQLFGRYGAFILAAIFTLACLTTCVGLINSISKYFSTLFKKVSYTKWVCIIVGFSFLVCNVGLNTILSISVPVLNAIYPVSIILIVLGLTDKLWVNNRFVYPVVVAGTAVISIIHAAETALQGFGIEFTFLHSIPLYKEGFSWVIVAAVMLVLAYIINFTSGRIRKTKKAEA